MNPYNPGTLASPSEIQPIANLFLESFDTDKDGFLKPSELYSMLSTLYRHPYQDNSIESFYKIWDTDHDGKVNISDIEAICRRYLLGEADIFKEKIIKKHEEKTKKKGIYSKAAENQLEVARRLFGKFDNDKTGILELNEVKLLMAESYKSMGMEFHPSDADAKEFMAMIDQNKDGKLHLEDYEVYVLKALKEAGIKVEEDQMRI